MDWDSLSNEAKSILRLIKDPDTGEYNLNSNIYIKVGEIYEEKEIKMMITQSIYDEIVAYIREDYNISAMVNCDGELFMSVKKEYKESKLV